MKIIKNNLKTKVEIRTMKDYPKKGIEFLDITPFMLDREAFNEIINMFVEELKDKNIEYILAPEARGFYFAGSIAQKINAGVIPIRKRGKLPPKYVETSVDYEKEYGKDQLWIPKLVEDEYLGKRVYILDDIYATGNTARAIEKAIKDLGGIVVGTGVIINIIELNNNKEVFSLMDVEEE